MRFPGVFAFTVAVVLLSGCSSQSDATPTPAAVSATLAAQLAASMSSAAQCPEADWRCFPTEATAAGGPLLGPAKAAGMRVSGVLVWPAHAGQALRGVAVQLSRPGKVGYTSLSELPGEAGLTPDKAWKRATQVRGTAALFSSDVYFARVQWNEHGRKMQLAVSKTLPGAVPSEAQLLATADALVLYAAA